VAKGNLGAYYLWGYLEYQVWGFHLGKFLGARKKQVGYFN